MRAWIAIVALAAGCDTKASASDPDNRRAASRPDMRSREYETCSASADCADDLRCFAQRCARTARSTVGDYYASVGSDARVHGLLAEAIDAYTAALGHYDAEKVSVPPDVDCAYGAVLAANRDHKDHAALGARVLHRCLRAAPVGSQERELAMAALATLRHAGLDPLLLGADREADQYLTKVPSGPSHDKVGVAVSALPQPKNFQVIADVFADPATKAALVGCWRQLNDATKKDSLATTIAMRNGYITSDYEDEPGRFRWKIDPAAALPPSPEATAIACVRGIVEPAVKALNINEAFSTKLTLLIK
jgi:hypothetical protein